MLNSKIISKTISCQIMNDSKNDKVLICFFEDENLQINAIGININSLERNNFNIIYNKNSEINTIKSILYNNGQRALVCYDDNKNDVYCIIFDIINKKWGKENINI